MLFLVQTFSLSLLHLLFIIDMSNPNSLKKLLYLGFQSYAKLNLLSVDFFMKVFITEFLFQVISWLADLLWKFIVKFFLLVAGVLNLIVGMGKRIRNLLLPMGWRYVQKFYSRYNLMTSNVRNYNLLTQSRMI